jgi:hypothetical protein
MKTVTKVIAGAFTAAAIFVGTNVNAQTTPKSALRLGVGIEGLAPVGDLHNGYNAGLGGTARLQYGVSDRLALTLTSGFYNFFGKTGTVDNIPNVKVGDKGVVPVKAGIKAFVASNFYLGGEAGVGIVTSNEAVGDSRTKFLWTPGIGFANKSWDVGARYENLLGHGYNYGYLGLRVAYGFGL